MKIKKTFLAVFISTGLLTLTSAIVLPIGFININKAQNLQKEQQINLLQNQQNNNQDTGSSDGQVDFIPGTVNPNELDPYFCDGWIIAVTTIITFNASAFVLSLIIIIYLINKKKINLQPNLTDF